MSALPKGTREAVQFATDFTGSVACGWAFELARFQFGKVLCAYCGEIVPWGSDGIETHAKACPKHPIFALSAEVASLRVALERSKRDTGYEIGLAFARGHETGSSTEREACARVAEMYPSGIDAEEVAQSNDIAALIRARSTKGEK